MHVGPCGVHAVDFISMILTQKMAERICRLCRQHLNIVVGRHKHFSFICRRNTILAFGYSRKHKTHPALRQFSYKSYSGIHAEFDVLRKLNFDVSGTYLINVRMNKDGALMLSRPCPCCTRMLIDRGVRTVYYSGNDQRFHRLNIL